MELYIYWIVQFGQSHLLSYVVNFLIWYSYGIIKHAKSKGYFRKNFRLKGERFFEKDIIKKKMINL
jgi:hypothetical protein